MWYSVYDTTTGEYLGGSALRSNIADPLPAGKAIKVDEQRMDQGNVWNTSTREWDARPAFRVLPIPDFLSLFTDDELFSFGTTNTDKTNKIRNVLQAWKDAQKNIDMDSTRTSTMMQFLVDDGVLTSGRRDAILA